MSESYKIREDNLQAFNSLLKRLPEKIDRHQVNAMMKIRLLSYFTNNDKELQAISAIGCYSLADQKELWHEFLRQIMDEISSA
jgi:hypothetical protein